MIGQEVSLEVWGAVAGRAEETSSAWSSGRSRRISLRRWTMARASASAPDPGGALRRRPAAPAPNLAPAVAEVLAELGADPDAVAYHFAQAGDARATEWLVRAGERAQRAFAWRTATERFKAVAQMLEADPARRR